MPPPELPDSVSVATFAALLNLTDRRVRQLVAAGLVQQSGRGQIALATSVQAIIADAREAREAAPLTVARARLADARARRAELDNLRADRELMDVAEAVALFQELAGVVVAGLSALPARIGGRDIGLRHRVEKECDAVRREFVAKFERGLP
ncbi:MAG: hypothetical protein K2X45_13865 [Phreatobacter sp.]|nr:hypothetical protein [Phreatobacter sp.]